MFEHPMDAARLFRYFSFILRQEMVPNWKLNENDDWNSFKFGCTVHEIANPIKRISGYEIEITIEVNNESSYNQSFRDQKLDILGRFPM